MADYQSSQGGYTPYNQYGANYGWDDPADYMQDFVVEESPRRKLINIVGSVASVAVVSAVVLWGYGTIVRDVSGIPVVAAMEGPVRVAPADPGGTLAENLGLAVNEVVAAGANNAPVEQVVLAPEQLDVAAEDAPLSEIMPVEEVEAVSTEFAQNDSDVLVDEANIPVPLDNVVDTEDDFAALANQLALAVVPQDSLQLDAVDDSVIALRPQIRPFPAGDSVQVASAGDDFVTSLATPSAELDVTALPAGTRLVQLGAYESPEIARVEWNRISGQFAEFFGRQKPCDPESRKRRADFLPSARPWL